MKTIHDIYGKISRTLALATALLAFAPGAYALGDTPPEGFEGERLKVYYYTEGIKKYRVESDTEGAMLAFDRAIELDSLYSPAYYEAANALAAIDPGRALLYSRAAVGLDSTSVWYSGQLGRLYIVTGDYNNAQKIYERLIELAPRNPEFYGMLALLYEQLGRPYSAISVLNRAENTIGKIEQLSQHKRELLLGAGMIDQAVEEARSIIAAYPYNYEGYMALAQLYAETRKFEAAQENYNMALALNPDGLDVLSSMNEYYRLKGDSENYLATARQLVRRREVPEDAKMRLYRELTSDKNFYRDNYLKILDIALQIYVQYPENYTAVTHYADNVRAGGDFEESLVIHKRYIATPRTELQPYMDVINMEAYIQRQDSVKKYTEIALERFPESPELYVRLGGTLSWLDRSKEAVKSYERGLKYAEGDSARSVILGVLGDEFHKQGNDKKSFKYYEQALALWDSNTVVLNNYAYYLSVVERDLEKALAMAQKVMELEPANPTYIDTYGWVLFKTGRLDKARSALRQAIALDTHNSTELMMHYGDILAALGDTYMATVYWNRALEGGHDEAEVKKRLETPR